VRKLLILFLLTAGLAGCGSDKTAGPGPNKPPETHLFLVIGDSLGQVTGDTLPGRYYSRQILHWYGDDPDGEVIGYQWAWGDTSAGQWTFTTDVMDTFYVPIRDTMGYFTFFVRAVDNDSALDATPAKMTFPIINSPPEVSFPFAFTHNYDTAYFVSLNYMTFNWNGGDPDGDLTIVGYDFYLGDSSMRVDDLDTVTWHHLDSLTTRYTFTNLQPGFYRFFLRCQDIAGAYSPVIFYPDTIRGKWEVKPVVGNILYIDDNLYFFNSEHIFTDILDSLYPGGYTSLNFERRTFYNITDIDSTLNNFDIVIWNAGSDRHFTQASGGIVNFLRNGGRLMTNMTYSSRDTAIYPFLPIDSVYKTNINRPMFMVIPPGTDTIRYNSVQIYPDTLYATVPLSFTFGFKPAVPVALAGMFGESGYEVLYVTTGDTVAVRYPAYDPNNRWKARVVLFSFAVFDCNGQNTFGRMYSNILQYEFQDE